MSRPAQQPHLETKSIVLEREPSYSLSEMAKQYLKPRFKDILTAIQ